MKDFIEKIKAKNPDLKEAEVIGLLYLIQNDKNLTNTNLIQKTGLPKETLRLFKATINEFLEDSTDDGVLLNEKGLQLTNEVELKPYEWSLVSLQEQLSKSTLLNAKTAQELKDTLAKVREASVLDPKRKYDQFFATEDSTLSKALLLEQKGDINDKSILILGDDDLLSITLGVICSRSQNTKYKEIHVVDIDQNILSAIDSFVQDNSLENITTQHLDVRKDIKPDLLNRFDVVITDPPYTKAGAELFLSRSVEMLKPADNYNSPYIYLYFGNSFKEPEKTLKLQDVINKHKLLVEDKINKFARYNGADSIGNASSVYILKTSTHTESFADYLDNEIYTFENVSEDKFPYVDHYTFKLLNVPASVVGSKKALQKACGQFCAWHKLNVVDYKINRFKGGGMTLTYVLAQSNMVVHTWPERGAVHIDLITCSPIAKKELFSKNLSELFNTHSIEVRAVE